MTRKLNRKRRAAATNRTAPGKSAPIPRQDWFSWFAQEASHLAGKPAAFLGAVGLILVWALAGPILGFSEAWQLVINTSTTIITFLMVFLIQSTQNRDTLALQVKLAELILRMPGAPNQLADAEDMSEKQLERVHEQYKRQARERLDTGQRRRSSRN